LSYAVNNGVRIHYEIVGSGPPLILQHGFTQSAKDGYRAGYVEALKPHYQLILVDARGHGESDEPHDAAAYTLSSRVNDIVAVMDSIGILRADYWGYSMGGWIGFGMAMERRHDFGQSSSEDNIPMGADASWSPGWRDAREFITSFLKRIGVDFDALRVEDKEQLLANDCRALAAAQQDRASLEAFLPAMDYAVPALRRRGRRCVPKSAEVPQHYRQNAHLCRFPALIIGRPFTKPKSFCRCAELLAQCRGVMRGLRVGKT